MIEKMYHFKDTVERWESEDPDVFGFLGCLYITEGMLLVLLVYAIFI